MGVPAQWTGIRGSTRSSTSTSTAPAVRGGLPHDLPAGGTVAGYFYRFRNDGSWPTLPDQRCTQVRVVAGQEPTPRAGVSDRQAGKTTGKGGCAVTMRARKSTGDNSLGSSIRWG